MERKEIQWVSEIKFAIAIQDRRKLFKFLQEEESLSGLHTLWPASTWAVFFLKKEANNTENLNNFLQS